MNSGRKSTTGWAVAAGERMRHAGPSIRHHIGWAVLSLFALVTAVAPAQEVSPAQDVRPADKVPQAVIDRLVDGQDQELIVEFDVGAILQEAAAMRRQAGIQHDDARLLAFKARRYTALKQAVLSPVLGREAELVRDYSHLPLAFVRVRTAAALKTLVGHVAVVAVYENQEFFLFVEESLPLINQPPVATAGHQGVGTTVAVLDTGVDYTRPTFGACTAPGVPADCKVAFAQDFAPEDSMLDDHGHGTNVAGIVLGVAPGAQVAALDVSQGSGRVLTTAILAAMNWAVENQAEYNIVAMNLSLGGGRFSAPCANSPFTSAFAQVRAAGILPVVAAGNEGYKDSLADPACVPGAVSVGAVYDSEMGGIQWSTCTDSATSADQVTCFSNSAPFLTLLAPGAFITVEDLEQGGTSQAAPHVAGATAVLKAVQPAVGLDQIVSVLQGSGVPITDPRHGLTTPRIDLQAAVEALGNGGGGGGDDETPTIVSPPPGSTLPGVRVTFQWTANGAPVAEWWLTIGSSPGGFDMYNSGSLGTSTSITLSGFPTDGRPIYVRLYYRLPAGWDAADFDYTAAGG